MYGEWISVKDSLPKGNGIIYEGTLEESEPVVVYGSYNGVHLYGTARFIYDHDPQGESGWNGCMDADYEAYACQITYWMKMPKPPKEEKNNAND